LRYSLARDGEPQLAFDGEQLAYESSFARGKHSWTELTLYVTDGGSFVVQTVARSTHRGYVDWFSARAYSTALEAVDGLRDRKRRTLSRLALALLEAASYHSPLISEALDAIEQTEEWMN
jgi:hypothetical protein